jgi:hypothetical protein
MKPTWAQLDRVNAEARAAHFGRVVLTFIASVFFAFGWFTAKLLGAVWFVVAWVFAAVRLGWRDARGRPAELPAPPVESANAWVEVE